MQEHDDKYVVITTSSYIIYIFPRSLRHNPSKNDAWKTIFYSSPLGFSNFSGVKLAVTLPKFNSSPLKIGRNPKGKSSSNHHFSGVGHVAFGCFCPQDRLLVLDCSKRFTAEEALRHPWLLAVNASAEKVVGLERVAPFRPKQNASIPAPCQRGAKWFRLTGVNKNHPLWFKDGTPT